MIVDETGLSRLDFAFANFLTQKSSLPSSKQRQFSALVARLSWEQRQGHNCILMDNAEKQLCLQSGLAVEIDLSTLDQLTNLPLSPLIVEQSRVYLQRYWQYEYRLARRLKSMAQSFLPITSGIDALLDCYFQPLNGSIDWQREAAKTAMQNTFCIITGGPGTGKTTTVVKILGLLQETAEKPLHIALAAPTGKAAMRLQESIGQRKNELPCTDQIKQTLPDKVTTIHRLLGSKPISPYFYHDALHPLVYDLVVIDEASMVDLALMSKLVDALKPTARLILLGDQEQLASVESGAVLANLTTALIDQTAELKTTHRFKADISALAAAINQQQAELAWELLQQPSKSGNLMSGDAIAYIAKQQADYLKLIKIKAPFQEIYAAFMRFQALCSNRQGSNSTSDVNYHVEQYLARENLISLTTVWYSGRPIIITQNNNQLHLYNGDIGICMPDAEQEGKLRVFFQLPDGSVKKFLPARIAHCETVFAMTIHKSQGSEFEEILILLPEQMNPVLTKELLYTAVTRAKQTVKIAVNHAVFHATIQQRVRRITGLVDKLHAL